MTAIIDGSLGITAPTYGGSVSAEYSVPVTAFKNRIINGAMVIDQRNAGASVTPTTDGQYTVDRWRCSMSVASKFSVQQQTSVIPTGFSYATKITSLSAYTVGSGDYFSFDQMIEGYNVADLGFGTANAKTITISFLVYSSLTGTFGAALMNSAGNRSYPFTYTISSANTWEQKTVTIVGDTSGTWLTTNGTGLFLRFGLGVGTTYSGTAGSWAGTTYVSATGATSVVGTNGATFYITGVQLEKGSTATSFDYRPYTTELQLCQRYCVVYGRENNYNEISGTGFAISATSVDLPVILSPQMRSVPSLSSSGNFQASDGASATTITSFSIVTAQSSSLVASIRGNVASGLTGYRPYRIESSNSTASILTLSAEL